MSKYLGKQLGVAFIVYIGQIFCGYIGGWSANVIIKLQGPQETPLPTVLSDVEASYIASLTFLGLVGPYIAGYLSNSRGRTKCLSLGGIIGAASFLLKALATNKYHIFCGRALASQAAGIIFVINLVYVAEIASTNIRGILLVGTGVSNSLGMVVAYSVGPYLSYANTSYFGFGLAVIFTVATIFLPESPIYYILKGQNDKAKDTLIALGRESDIDTHLAMKIEEPGVIEAWIEIFSVKSNRKAMFITMTLMILQQMSGVMVVILFATTIFNELSTGESHIYTIKLGGMQVIASCITPIFIERLGRRLLMLITTAVCCLSLILLGVYFYLVHIQHPATASLTWLPLVTLITFLMSYNFGFGIIPGTLTGEMFDSKVRGPGSVFSITVSWVVGFVISCTYVLMVKTWGSHVTFWCYGGICTLAYVFTYVFVPETKGKSLLEIQEMLSR